MVLPVSSHSELRIARRYPKACHEATMQLADLIKELLVDGKQGTAEALHLRSMPRFTLQVQPAQGEWVQVLEGVS